MPNKAYSLWRVNGFQQGFCSVANLGFVFRKVLRNRHKPYANRYPQAKKICWMKINNPKIKVDSQSINPTLICSMDLEFDRSIEIPISVSGKLIGSNHKVLSLLNEHQINREYNYGLRLLSKEEKEQSRKDNNSERYYVQLSAELSQLALNSIENQRNKNKDKSINFTIELVIKSLNLTKDISDNRYEDFIQINIEQEYLHPKIEQSEWINNYSEKLGIGKFLLLELNVPNEHIPDFWSDLFNKLKTNVFEMENSIQSGDWQKTMLFARKFFENIKIGDKKKGHKVFREELNKKMMELQHSEKGIQNLYDGIWQFFEFISKFIHDKDTDGNSYEVLPIPSKEDAYFAYALSIGLLGLVGKKVK